MPDDSSIPERLRDTPAVVTGATREEVERQLRELEAARERHVVTSNRTTYTWTGPLREDTMISVGGSEPEMFAVMIGRTNGYVLEVLARAGVLDNDDA